MVRQYTDLQPAGTAEFAIAGLDNATSKPA